MAPNTNPRDDADRAPVARVDVAHRGAIEPHAEVIPQPAEVAAPIQVGVDANRNSDVAVEQLQRHASELSSQLRRRYRELSKWEATLHAQRACWEDEQRANRIWVSEQTVALAEREQQLQAWSERLERQQRELEQTGKSADAVRQRARELDQREANLRQLEQQLEQQHRQVRAQAAWLDAAQQDLVSHAETAAPSTADESIGATDNAAGPELGTPASNALDNTSVDHTNRLRALESLEKLTRDRLDWLAQAQADFDRQHDAWRQRTDRQRRHLAQMWQRRRQALQRQADRLQQQQRQLHARREALRGVAKRLLELQRDEPACHTDVSTPRSLGGAALAGTASDMLGASTIEQFQQLVDQLAQQRRALTRSRELLGHWAAQRDQQLRAHEHELEQTRAAIDAAEVRLAETRRDALQQWQHEQTRIRKWLDMLKNNDV